MDLSFLIFYPDLLQTSFTHRHIIYFHNNMHGTSGNCRDTQLQTVFCIPYMEVCQSTKIARKYKTKRDKWSERVTTLRSQQS